MKKTELTATQAEALHRTILNDPQLRVFEAELFRIYSLATPQTTIDKNGEVKTVWLDSDNDPTLQLIKDSIDARKQQLSTAYRGGHVFPFTVYDEVGPPPWASDQEKKDFVKAYEMAKPRIDDEMIKAFGSKLIAGIDPYKRLRWWQKLLNFFRITKYNTNGSITIFGTAGEKFIPAYDPNGSKPKKK